ncbi:hypothetical protein D777_01713 [Marinobacter nitratireducens]|uniref:Uncharacterized protein n=1 Tax=Marinobacter nitratireducens TaxID=1137280 RepID=A0A072N101_9GAMM|nr:hypothetical protein [Marinobacter nitratireducens]KEF31364.1 hypothetical protein D777_01713 [Marinobacter nitratireducens]
MTENTRIRFLVLLSVPPEQMDATGDFIAERLTQRFGGVTRTAGAGLPVLTGYWADDGPAFKSDYDGEIHKESVMALLLSVLPDDEHDAYTLIQNSIANANVRFKLGIQHVHVETQVVKAHHFSVPTAS